MKKLFFFLLLLSSTCLSAQEYDRNILIEVFTNSHCPLCPSAHVTLDAYLANSGNSANVNYIYYHMPFPYSDDQLNQANTADASARNNYYGPFSSTPKGIFDGATQSGNYVQWGNNIDSRLTEKSPVSIILSGSKEGADVVINSDITFASGASINNAVLQVVVVEDVSYSGRNGISFHKNVMRKIANSSGESISAPGTQSISTSISLSQNWVTDNVSFVVFVQNNSTKEIYQSATIDYIALGITDIAAETEIPSDFALSQNYPNPFNPTTTIEYSIQNLEVRSQKSELVTLKIYDVLGNEITTLVNEYKAPGNYKATFNSTSGGKLLPSGIYFYKLSYNGRAITKKLTLLK